MIFAAIAFGGYILYRIGRILEKTGKEVERAIQHTDNRIYYNDNRQYHHTENHYHYNVTQEDKQNERGEMGNFTHTTPWGR